MHIKLGVLRLNLRVLQHPQLQARTTTDVKTIHGKTCSLKLNLLLQYL